MEHKSSTHKVEVVPLVLTKHPNADRLSVAQVFGFTCVVATDQWAGHTHAAYLPPDSLADVSRPEFAFLARDAKADGKARVKAKKLRGVLSFGLLVPAPAGSAPGDDVAELLGVEHYEAPVPGVQKQGGLITGGEAAKAPDVYCVKYDVEAGRRYAQQVFTPGEPVVITEKIHGANGRYVFHDGRMHCGSRTEWKKEYPTYEHITLEFLESKVGEERATEILEKLHSKPKARNLWWQALDRTPGLRRFCEANPDVVVYGEVYGAVQDLAYGHTKGVVSFAAFDLMRDGKWLDHEEARNATNGHAVPWVPDVAPHPVPYDFETVCREAEGPSLVPGAGHCREGVVVKPVKERYDERLGRVQLKWVGAGYLERSK